MQHHFSESELMALEDLLCRFSANGIVTKINIAAICRLIEKGLIKADKAEQIALGNNKQQSWMFHSLQFEQAEMLNIEVDPSFLSPPPPHLIYRAA